MKVILLQDVPKVGRRYEVVTVSTGFARNYLLPRGLAKSATPAALKELEERHEEEVKRAEEELAGFQDLASRLDGLEIEIPIKVSPTGEAYSAVSTQKITQVLESLGYKIKKGEITLLDGPIKHIGEYRVVVGLKHGLEAKILIAVVAEEETKQHLPPE